MTETTRRLKLRIPSGTSQDSRYNLQRIDDFAGAYSLSDTGDLIVAVRGDLILLPNARSSGGSGSGGVLSFGTSEENVAVTFYTSTLNFEKPLSLKDQTTGGNKYLNIQYKSDPQDLAPDTSANRTLTVDMQGGNRTLTLGGDLSTAGSLTTAGSYSATLTFTAATSVTFPETGLLLTSDSIATVTNKTIVVANNTVITIPSGNLAATELNAALAELQTDIDTRAVNATFTSHTGASTGVHGIAGAVVGTTDIQTLTNKSISGSSNTLTDIPPASLSSTTGTGAAVLANSPVLVTPILGTPTSATLTNATGLPIDAGTAGTLPITRGGTGQVTQNASLNALLPTQTGNANYVLQTDGTDTSWAPAGSGTVTSVSLSVPSEFSVSGSPVTTAGTLTFTKANQNANLVYAGPSSGGAATPTFRSLAVDDIPTAASFSGKDTDDLPEGAGNLYYQDSYVETLLATKTTDDIAEGVTNKYDQTVSLSNGAGISVTGTYPSFTVASTITQYTDSLARAAISVTDTSSVDLTYSAGNIQATVLPGGVNHNSLLNYVANEHIDHSSVSVATSATSGLAGGGDLTTTRNLIVSPTSATAATPASGDIVLFADVSDSSNLKKATIQELLDLGGGKVTATWVTGDGTSKAITHSLGTDDISFNVYDLDTKEEIWVDTAIRTSTSVLTLTSSSAPSGTGWRVVVRK